MKFGKPSRLLLPALLISTGLAGCADISRPAASIPRGVDAYSAIDQTDTLALNDDYRIGAQDVINVSVFQEDALSREGLEVNTSGNISLPLVGSFPASGQTSAELSRSIERELAAYLTHPRVNVTVANSASQKVIVQGGVTEPGVYPIRGSATLLEALSLAKGETRTARLDEVVVFRTINDQPMAAVFDVKAIRSGLSPDPEIYGNDKVVVGFSAARTLWQDILQTTPLFSVFRPY